MANIIGQSGGKLTALTNTPVVYTNQLGITNIFFTPKYHQFIPIYDGSDFTMVDLGGELILDITSGITNPSPALPNCIYDVFVWLNAGTPSICIGTQWASNIARGTTPIGRLRGVQVNYTPIQNGPPIYQGTYVGTIATNQQGTVDWKYGGLGNGGIAGSFNIWSYYNRNKYASYCFDTGPGYIYNSNIIRQARNSPGNQINFLQGLLESSYLVTYQQNVIVGATLNNKMLSGIGVDSTTVYTAATEAVANQNIKNEIGMLISWNAIVGQGVHSIKAIESSYSYGNDNTFCVFGGAQLTVEFEA